MFVVYKCLKYNLRALFCVCVWVCLSVISFSMVPVSFTICQKGIAELSNSWLVPVPCPAQALWPSIQRASKGAGKMFCIFSILVFQSPLVGVGSSYLVISLCCLGQFSSWMTGTSLVGEAERGLLLPRLPGASCFGARDSTRERGKVVLVITIEELLANFLSL